MNGIVCPSMEDLESRRLFSTSFGTGGLCLIPPPARAPAPAPALIPVPTTHRHHHRSLAAAPSPSPVGDWASDSVDASLQVHVSQASNGDLFAKVAFSGVISFQGSAQLTYRSSTGQFSMWVMSPKLVVKFSGTMTTTGEFNGSLETYTRNDAFKGQFVLQRVNLRSPESR
jgi:hypothetical protein